MGAGGMELYSLFVVFIRHVKHRLFKPDSVATLKVLSSCSFLSTNVSAHINRKQGSVVQLTPPPLFLRTLAYCLDLTAQI